MTHIAIQERKGSKVLDGMEQVTDEQYRRYVMNVLNYGEESISVAVEEVKSQDWAENVYKPDIVNKARSYTRNRDTRRE